MKKVYEFPEIEEIRMDLESDFLEGSTTGQDDPITCAAYVPCEDD